LSPFPKYKLNWRYNIEFFLQIEIRPWVLSLTGIQPWVISLNNIFCWFAWSLILARCMLDAWQCMKIFCYIIFEECIYECMKFDFFFLLEECIYECMKFDFCEECMLKCMKFVWIWIFWFCLFFQECKLKSWLFIILNVCMNLILNENIFFKERKIFL